VNLCKQCNSEITHNRKRRLCTDCLKQEQREAYHFKKDVYNTTRKLKKKLLKRKETYSANRKLKRRVNPDNRVCVICKVEFKTSHAIKCTCSDKCSSIHQKNLARQNYHNKKVTLCNTK